MFRLLSLFALVAFAAQAEPAPQQKLSTVQKTLEASKQDARAIERKLKETERDLDQLKDKATRLAEQLQATETRVSREEANLEKANAQLAAKEREYATRRQEYADTIASLIRMNQLPPGLMVMDGEHLEERLRTASALEHTNKVLAARARALKKETEQLHALRKRAGESRERTARERATLASQQRALGSELNQRQKLQERLQSDHARAQAKVAQLSRESKSLSELIGKLEQNRPQLAPRGRKLASLPSTSAARGRMKAPVSGPVIHRFGQRKNENETYRGLVIRGRPGGTVVAPYHGEVVFTGPFMDYGRMVLLKHADGYISLLAGLGGIHVTLNQRVSTGEPIGSLPGNGRSELYIELRASSKPIDPAGWFVNLGPTLARR